MNYDGDSYWDRMLRRAFADEKAKRDAAREAEVARAVERITRQARTAECPCCGGSGRVGIALGAKDDQ
jgi:hypothetical protein